MIFDTHSHCYWENLEPRIDEILDNMHQHNIIHAVQIGCDVETSKKAIALATRFSEVFFATVWFHPENAQDVAFGSDKGQEIFHKLDTLIQNHREKIVAVGETGLDFHYLDGSDGGTRAVSLENLSEKAKSQIQNQKDWWLAQSSLAQKYGLPLVIHTRDAREVTLVFMRENSINRCVMHCFSEDFDFAKDLMDFSNEIYFSFSGIVTYKSAPKIADAAARLPLSRMLTETDAPFLSPQAVRGTVNEPANTRFVLEKIIELRSESAQEIEDMLYENALRFFCLKK